MKTHPIQPILLVNDVARFKENKIVSKLLDFSQSKGYGLNEIACDNFSQEDHIQLAQLIGYSHSGFGDLSYVTDAVYETAWKMYKEGSDEKDAKIEFLENQLKFVKDGLRGVCSELFHKHPDDLV